MPHTPPSFMVRPAAGKLSPEQLEQLAQFMRQRGIASATLPGQGLAVPITVDTDPEALRTLLSLPAAPEGHSGLIIRGCPGSAGCKNGQQDTLALAEALEQRLAHHALPAKVRVGLSGCPRCCGESYVRDLGFIGTKNGWRLVFGGNAGGKPRIADTLATNLTTSQALDLADTLLSHYCALANKNQRTARFVEAVGLASIQEALGLKGEGE